jgi:hypothetical protein
MLLSLQQRAGIGKWLKFCWREEQSWTFEALGILPAGRLVFEPDGDTPRQAHQLGQFTPDEVRLYLPDRSTSDCWHLGDQRRTGPRHYIQQVDQDADRYTLTATAVTGIHKLHYLNSGIQVFYRKDSDAVVIHALSIPWESLINKLLKDPGPKFQNTMLTEV